MCDQKNKKINMILILTPFKNWNTSSQQALFSAGLLWLVVDQYRRAGSRY